jgi:hypothetical protein
MGFPKLAFFSENPVECLKVQTGVIPRVACRVATYASQIAFSSWAHQYEEWRHESQGLGGILLAFDYDVVKEDVQHPTQYMFRYDVLLDGPIKAVEQGHKIGVLVLLYMPGTIVWTILHYLSICLVVKSMHYMVSDYSLPQHAVTKCPEGSLP